MKVTFAVWVMCCTLIALPALADPAPLPRLGIGVSLPAAAIAVPVNLNDMLRVEPSLGIVQAGTNSTATDKIPEASTSATTLGLGLGAFYQMRKGDHFVGYVGPRLGVLMASSTDKKGTTTTSTSQTTIAVGAVLGGEHFLGDHFSLGAEVGIGYAMAGETKTTVDPAPNPAPAAGPVTTGSALATSSAVVVRYWF
jgi:hypothetical protein